MKEIGERLKGLRTGADMSQIELAAVLGVQQSTMTRFESGQSTPKPEVLIQYADYFHVSLDYLYCRTDRPQGILYDYQPQVLERRVRYSREMSAFVEMCLDPNSPLHEQLKDALLEILAEHEEAERGQYLGSA